MSERLISELLILPDKVRKGDFVLNLSKGVTEPGPTLDQYVVTQQLLESFDDALGFIRSSVEASNSKACYLHGSFGAGKSHFMAVLHLILQHNPEVRARDDLAAVCAKHGWVEDKRFLLVPYHMIGARNMESAILGGYVDHVMTRHPEAPLPGVYLAGEIFENARLFRERLGDEEFFRQLNRSRPAGPSPSVDKWGKIGHSSPQRPWTPDRFEAAVAVRPSQGLKINLEEDEQQPEQPTSERSLLVGALVENIFTAYRGVADSKDESYVNLDEGLSIISTHAKSLGYDGLILFLDELILWLASHSADLGFVQGEGNKLAKLVESRRSDRPVPIISFVARQRDLRELIGENVTGSESLNFSDVLSHWEGRFHTITLEDRNLPVIAQKRVLRPKDAASRAELEEAFEKTAQVRQEILEVLLTREADRSIFKLVYPFSPALIQALVAISSVLQRERTALRLMLQLLYDRRNTLRLGEVIPLGDLWDVVANGDEVFSSVMRAQFDNAKKLYHNKLRPMLEQQHEIDPEVARGRAGEDRGAADKLRLFENDDRLVKSLMLAALVDGVESLKNMTCMRLAALNHGTIRSRIPGREHQLLAQKLRTWAGMVGEIKVGDEPTNPTVALQISGVDTEGIVEAARVYDNPGNRQFRLRQMLFKSLGVPEQDELSISHGFVWRGSRRSCDVLFTNVRSLPDESLKSGDEWKLVVDFPFDSEGHSPIEDLDRVGKFRERNDRQRTLVWLPSFFSARTQAELGKLVIIDRLLLGGNLDQHAQHLSLQDRQTARLLLQNQQSALSQRLLQAVEAAYAIRSEPTPGTLDAAYDMSEAHFQSLDPSLTLQRPVGANLGEALEHLLDQALSNQYPKHPKFGQEIKPGKDLRQILEVCQEAARTPDGRVFVEDKALRQKLRNVCNPLDLGQMSETHFVLGTFWRNHFNRQLSAAELSSPTAADLRRWMDEPEDRGLPREIQNLLIFTYADQTNRSFWRHNVGVTPTLEDIPGEVELRQQALPDIRDWQDAVQRAAALFGHVAGQLLNASSLAALATKVGETVRENRADCEALADRLPRALAMLGQSEDEIDRSDRVRTARAVKALLSSCDGKEPTKLVAALVAAPLETNETTMARGLKSARSVLDALNRTRWDLFQAVSGVEGERSAEAARLVKDVANWLRSDEHALAGGLASRLSEAEGRAIKLLTPPKPIKPPGPGPVVPPPPPPGWKTVRAERVERLDSINWSNNADILLKELKRNPRYRLTVEWTIEEGPA